VSANLKLFMMGTRGTGKTCYMLAMYAAMSMSVEGFTFSTQDPDDDIELSRRWDRLLAGSCPVGTIDSKDWAFNCNFGFRKLDERLKNASCIILCVAGDQLASYVDGGPVPNGIRRFNSLMARFHEHRNQTVPVVIAITKADMCKSPEKPMAEMISEGIDILKSGALRPLFEPGADWLVMFCPVTLGFDLTFTDDARVLGKIAPHHVHLPVTFAIYTQLESDIAGKEREVSELEHARRDKVSEVDRLQEGFWSRMFNRGEVRVAVNRIEELKRQANLSEHQASDLRETYQRIETSLMTPDVFIYHNGKRVRPKTR
jgi:GTPase SAR1 family protein